MVGVRYHFNHAKRSAFSLIELVIVIVIIGMLSAIAVPRFARSRDIYRAETAARRVVRDLIYAREIAQAQSSTITVTYDTVTDTYTLSGVASLDHPGEAYTVSLAEHPFLADLTAAVFDGDAVVQFDGYGAPDSGGTLTIEAGRQRVDIELNQDTGLAAVAASGGK